MKRHCLNTLYLTAVFGAAMTVGSFSASAQALSPQGFTPLEASQAQGQAVESLNPNQLDDLVAPIALYPDPLLSQILVASTYPLEVVEASQWMQQNRELKGASLTQAAEQQNWDPSVQGLVVYPDVVKRLNQDVTWTTNLGNAFLSQENDVMDAVQRMRVRAQDAGKLTTSSQQLVTSTGAGAQPLIQIMPADPQVIYVPSYDPSYIYGPSSYYPYPNWGYPASYAGNYLSYGSGIPVGLYFGNGGWGGWNSYGWMPGWGTRTVVVNNGYLSRYNFNLRGAPVVYGTTPWFHNGYHRLGVPYSNQALVSRYSAFARPGYPARLYGNRFYNARSVQPFAAARPGVGFRATPNRSFVASPNRRVSNFGVSNFRAPAAPVRSSPAPVRSGPTGGGFRPSGGSSFHGSSVHSGGGGGHAGGSHGGGHR